MATVVRSPLRWQVSSSSSGPARQGSMSSAACKRLRHLQAVATWASAEVPPLGAFLGSRLASVSQLLGSQPLPSPHLTCQRCETILQVGVNCSVRVRNSKRKKRRSVSKEFSAPINSILYYCHYCLFKNVKLGTSKAYVKTKLSEVAARHKLLELNKDLGENRTGTSNNELISASKVLSTESAGSSGKRTKRKGWLSLKQLAASSADLSPVGRPVFMRSENSNLSPPVKLLDSPKVIPKFSQVAFKYVTPISSFKEQNPSGVTSINANLESEECSTAVGDVVSKETSNLVVFHGVSAIPEQSTTFTTKVCIGASPFRQQTEVSDLGVEALSSECDAEFVRSIFSNDVVAERQLTYAAESPIELGQNDTSGVTMEEEKKEHLSCHQSDADASMLDQPTVADSVNKSTFAAQCNFSDAVSQINIESVAPTLFIQGVMAGKDRTSSPSSINVLIHESLPDMLNDGFALKTSLSPFKEKEVVLMSDIYVTVNSGTDKPARLLSTCKHDLSKSENENEKAGILLSKKRQRNDCDKWDKITKMQKLVASSGHLNTRKGRETSNFTPGRRKVQSKKKPLFRKMGRHWFTKCRSKKFKWRRI